MTTAQHSHVLHLGSGPRSSRALVSILAVLAVAAIVTVWLLVARANSGTRTGPVQPAVQSTVVQVPCRPGVPGQPC